MNSPMRLGVSPAAATPTGFYRQRFLRLYFPGLELWVVQSVLLPSCPSWFIFTQMWDLLALQPPGCWASSPPWLPISSPPTRLNKCFFFNSLVIRLLYNSIFWQFWLYLFLNLLSFFWLCKEVNCTYLCRKGPEFCQMLFPH